jgi:hypothetical protein
MKYNDLFLHEISSAISLFYRTFKNFFRKKHADMPSSILQVLPVILVLFITMQKPVTGMEKHSEFEIGSEGEVPVLIKYGNKIPGFSSNTLYAKIPLGSSDSSPHSLILGFNSTVYGLAEISSADGSWRSNAVTMGWWPLNPIVWGMTFTGPDANDIILFSPLAGYSYRIGNIKDFELSLTATAGVVYGQVDKPDMNANEENPGDNKKMLRSYDEIKSIDHSYGCRLNAKLKFMWESSGFRYGICTGYTHYIFREVYFNSIDVGTFVSITF